MICKTHFLQTVEEPPNSEKQCAKHRSAWEMQDGDIQPRSISSSRKLKCKKSSYCEMQQYTFAIQGLVQKHQVAILLATWLRTVLMTTVK